MTEKLKDNQTEQVHVVKDLTFSFITTTNFCGFSMLNLTFLQVQNKMKDTNNHSKFLKPDHSLSIIFDHRARRNKQIGSYTLGELK